MLAFLCLAQVVLCSAHQHIALVVNISLQNCLKVHNLWHTVVKSKHICTDSVLQFGKGIKMVKHNLWVCFLFKFHHNAHTFAVRFIAQVAYALNAFVLNKFGNSFNQLCLVNHIWNFGNNNLVSAV